MKDSYMARIIQQKKCLNIEYEDKEIWKWIYSLYL